MCTSIVEIAAAEGMAKALKMPFGEKPPAPGEGPSLWLGAPNDPQIVRDAKGNALVRYVGGAPVNTGAYRLPEVAVGQNQYVPLAPQFNDGSFPGLLRMLSGSHVDLTAQFASHATYVQQVTLHARHLQALGYLRVADADAIIQRAAQANIGA